MITTVHDGARAIVKYALGEAVKCGNLKCDVAIQDNALAEKLDFNSSGHFKVCIQYLVEKGLVSSAMTDDARHLTLTAAAIDFLEEAR